MLYSHLVSLILEFAIFFHSVIGNNTTGNYTVDLNVGVDLNVEADATAEDDDDVDWEEG